jgi:uridine kinase
MALQRGRMSISAVAQRVDAGPPRGAQRVRVSAVDGRAGAGKTTLAERLATALGNVPVVPTDDFASWDEPFDWWPRLLDQVLRPLAAGKTARYQRYDWARNELCDWVEVPESTHVVLEGASSSRLAFRPYLSFTIWVETPPEICLARGIERDGEDMRPQWERWIAEENLYIRGEAPDRRADLVVAGAPTFADDPGDDVTVLRDGSALRSPML